jgi:hypothetical protein
VAAREARDVLFRKYQHIPECLFVADSVESAFFCWRPKFPTTADAFYTRRREGPYRFAQERPRSSISSYRASEQLETFEIQLSRDFQSRSIFDFCNSIGTFETCLAIEMVATIAATTAGFRRTPSILVNASVSAEFGFDMTTSGYAKGPRQLA